MTTEQIAHPTIAAQDAWLAQRLILLEHEKELTKLRDRVNAERRRLPMVKIEKDYKFEGPKGSLNLEALFAGRRQLVIYHFMFAPDWNKGCSGCTWFVDSLGQLDELESRDTTFALVSRARFAKLEAYKAERGWKFPWYSSFGCDFNYDFQVAFDESIQPIQYNYLSKDEIRQRGLPYDLEDEEHGLSVFFRLHGAVYHTYSTYGRGTEGLSDAFSLLDTTPYGRQQAFEDSPAGWPQQPTYG